MRGGPLLVTLLVLGASVAALLLVRERPASADATGDFPALTAAPALKLRLFYGGLLAAATASLLPFTGDAPLALVLLLLLAGIPTLGHQTIGLTPARHTSRTARRFWLLGVAFPVLVLALGAAVVAGRGVERGASSVEGRSSYATVIPRGGARSARSPEGPTLPA